MSDDNNNNTDSNTDNQLVFDDDDEAFVDLNHAVEVEVGENGDEDVPMDDDDDDDDDDEQAKDDNANNNANDANDANNNSILKDMSIQTITSHKPSSVFTVSSHMNKSTNTLSIITGGGDDKAYLHKIDNNNNLQSMLLNHAHTDSVSCVDTNESFVSKDLKKTPKYIAVGAYDGSIVLYNPDTGDKIQVLDGPTDVEFVAFHPKGGSVLLAGSISDATVWMYHLPTSKCLQVFVGHESHGDGGGVTGGSFTPDGKFALTIGMDGTMRLWAPRTGVCKHVFKFHSDDGSSSYGGGDSGGMKGLTCLAVDGGLDGQLAIAGGEDGLAHVVHLQGKKVVAKLCHFDISQGGSGTTGAGNTASGGGGMAVDGDNEEEIMMISSVEAVGFASKNVNPNWVATGGSDGKLKVWDLTFDGGQCRQTCEVKDVLSNDNDDSTSQNGTGGVTRLKWHPTLPIIIASYSDAAVRLWDARNGTLVHTLTGGGNSSNNENQINDISVEFLNTEQVQGGTGTGNAGSLIVVTGNDDGDAKVYNVDVGAVIAEAQGKSQS